MIHTLTPPKKLPTVRGYGYVKPIGRGIWTEVHLYENTSTGAKYAFKFFNPTDFARQIQAKIGLTDHECLLREVLEGNTRSLPGLAYNSLEIADNLTPFVREEYLDRFLDQVLAERKPTLEETVDVALGIAEGLNSLHTVLGRVHSDVHPGNIAFTTDGDVKLSDFGTSTVGKMPGKDRGYEKTRAPERFLEEEVTKASDVYSASATIYFMLTGEYPTDKVLKEKSNHEEVIRRLHSSADEWDSAICQPVLEDKRIPKIFKNLLYQGLSHKSKRIQDGAGFLKHVKAVAKEYAWKRPENLSHRIESGFLKAAGAAVFLLAAAAGIYYSDAFDTLKKEQVQTQTQTEYEIKARVFGRQEIELAVDNINLLPSEHSSDHILSGELFGWFKILKDRRTAFAAFLNPDAVYNAIKENDEKEDYFTIMRSLERLDPQAYESVRKTYDKEYHHFTDYVFDDGQHKAQERWTQAADNYARKKAEKLKAKNNLPKDSALIGKWGFTTDEVKR